MPLTEKHRAEIYSLIDAACILDSTSPRYRANSVAWSTAYEKQPQLVLVPSSIESLQKIIKYLYQTTLDFAIRGSGCGNSSASDVVVSLQAFNNVDFDAQDRVVHVGAGLTLAEIEGKLLSLVRRFQYNHFAVLTHMRSPRHQGFLASFTWMDALSNLIVF